MSVLTHNLFVLQAMKTGEIAKFADPHYPAIRKEDDGFYFIQQDGSYTSKYRYRSLAQLGSYFLSSKLACVPVI